MNVNYTVHLITPPQSRGATGLDALAVVFERPRELSLSRLMLTAPTDSDVVLETTWTGISSGTERLLWTGSMPDVPGMG